ncbi:hypothetical protein OX284_003160 [Flavobacterium sp. SUN046]|uniref:hypothetical protein n=1 Tax=Flavobacterium sp. SUN046 TaxID=3002440 RepID=UPI002DB660AC|nr:hypothetical protein [Flavobacterium sp. SUN046]MEC4048416.1 hypothetical protein [Flavobacterium sp. SUN046]
MTLKSLLLLFVLISSFSFSQEKEIENFNKEIDFYIDFTLQKFPDLPVNEVNQTKFRKKVDAVFKEFVLQKDSNLYDKLITSRDNPNLKFIRVNKKCEVTVTTFTTNHKSYSVYGYTSMNKINYFVKDNEANTIVYEGDSKSSSLDDIIYIDENHILLVVIVGDYHYGREVMVLSTKKQPWTVLKAFEGKAFGQVPMEYYNSKYVKKRAVFHFSCNDFPPMYCPKDFNKIAYDSNTKTLSYKIYTEGKRPQLVTAKWENELFKIDDYNMRSNSSDVGVPD